MDSRAPPPAFSLSLAPSTEAESITLEIDAPAVEEKVTLVFDNDGALLKTGISSIAVHPKDGITLKVENTTIVLTKDDITLTC